MDSERVAQLFAAATELDDSGSRAQFVSDNTADDPELRQELSGLLAAYDASENFLEEPVLTEAAALVPDLLGSALVGSAIGSWRIDALLQTGGMGSVFEANRVGEDFTQRAALKLVRVGFESPELVARFARERQLLAQVEHPNIARLLDGGTTEDGLPWLAMDYVDGLPIDVYADHQRLGITQRLALFDQVADAIAYLHQNLITHRDIKLSNVLVDKQGRVKVLDFGIASLLSDTAVNAEATAERRLSFGSAAPEQLRGGSISTATDVYGLGMLLYQLLAGVAPYRIHSELTAAQIEELICERDPPLASAAVAAASDAAALEASRATTAARLAQSLRGDLDTIIAKALRKDPARRYRSVAELRVDIANYQGDRPIQARADSAAYRVGKFLRRHWKGMSATALVIASLGAGLGIALWQADEARLQRDRAQTMNDFIQEVLAEADPYNAGGDKTVRDTLVEASARLQTRFDGKPLLEASLRQVIGGVQAKLRDLDAAEQNLLRSVELSREHVPDHDLTRLRAEADLAWVYYERDAFDEAISLYRSILSRIASGDPDSFRGLVHNDLGVAYNRSGQYEAAIAELEQALALVAGDDKQRAATLINLGYAYGYLDRPDRAELHYREAIAVLEGLGEAAQTAELAYALNNYGRIVAAQDREEEALALYRKSLRVRQRVFGERSDAVGAQHLNIGRLLLDLERPAEAGEHLLSAVELLGQYRDPDSFYIYLARGSYARAVLLTASDAQQLDTARRDLAQSLAGLRADSSPRTRRFVRQFESWLDPPEPLSR